MAVPFRWTANATNALRGFVRAHSAHEISEADVPKAAARSCAGADLSAHAKALLPMGCARTVNGAQLELKIELMQEHRSPAPTGAELR